MDRIMEISKTKTKTNGLDKELEEIYGIDLDLHIEVQSQVTHMYYT